MKNFEEFKRISHENEDKITSLEFINKNLKEALEKAQEEEKKFEARNSEILFQNQLVFYSFLIILRNLHF